MKEAIVSIRFGGGFQFGTKNYLLAMGNASIRHVEARHFKDCFRDVFLVSAMIRLPMMEFI